MSLRINDTDPDFTADTTRGAVRFQEWTGDNWAILLSQHTASGAHTTGLCCVHLRTDSTTQLS